MWKEINRRLDLVKEKLLELNMVDYSMKLSSIQKKYGALKETFTVDSVEKLYEKSKNVSDFLSTIRKLISFYEKYVDKLKDFERDYKNIIDKASIKDNNEEKILTEILNKVTEVDEFFSNEIKKIII